MVIFSSSFLETMPKLVAQLEADSSVEVVVVAAEQSGSYGDVEAHAAFAFCVLGLLFAIHGPIEFSVDLLVAWAVLFYAAGLLIAARIAPLHRLLTSRRRRHNQVVDRARAAFFVERIASTRERTGILLYLSALEREAVILTDTGVDARVPAALFHTLQAGWGACASLPQLEEKVLAQLPQLAQPLSQALPRALDDINELPDEVRLRRA